MRRGLLIIIMMVTCTVTFAQGDITNKYSASTLMFLSEQLGETQLPQINNREEINLITTPDSPIDLSKEPGLKLYNTRPIAEAEMVNGVKMISAFIAVKNNDFSGLESLGVIFEAKFKDLATTLIPVDKIEEVAALDNVTRIEVAEILQPTNDLQRSVTQAGDAISNSAAAQALGLTKQYTGKNVILGIIDTGIDFQHLAFKDKSGNTRIVRAYTLSGSNSTSLTTYSSTTQINNLTYDTNTGDHGTHTSSTAGGSSVIVNGTTVTVTDDHANATYGGMAPEANLVIAGLSSLYTTSIGTAIQNICNYADQVGKPCVISLSLGSQVGPHDGTGTIASIVNQYAGDNHIIVYAASNDGMRADAFVEMGTSNGGGMYASGTSTSSKPMIVNVQRSFSNADGNVEMLMPTITAYARTANVATSLKFHVVNVNTGEIVYSSSAYSASTTIDMTGSTDLAQYFKSSSSYSNMYGDAGKIRLVRTQDTNNSKYYWQIYAPIMLSTSYADSDGDGVYNSDYMFCVSVYPTSSNSSTIIDMWENSYSWFGTDLNLNSSSYNYCKGNDECSVSDNACYSNVISVGAYVTKNSITDYAGTAHDWSSSYPNVGDHAYFSSWQTAGYGPLGTALPHINAPGARIVAAINHYHTASVDEYSYWSDDYIEDLVVNNTTYPYAAMEGTSMATPCVSGIIAQWLQACVEVGKTPSPDYIKEVMAATWDTDEWTNGTGSGAHGAKTFGTHGKINAIKGLQYILGVTGGPTITATPTELAFTGYATMTYTKEVTVTGISLEGNITVTKAGDSAFSVDKTTITQTNGSATATLTITWSPTAAGNTTGTITLTSSNAESVTISLTGTAEAATPTIIADQESMTFEAIKGETDTQTLNVSGKFLTENVTVAVSGTGFSINTTSIANADALSDDGKDITVTFNAPTATGTYEGTLTLTSAGAETVTVSLTGISKPKQTTATIYQLTNAITAGNEYLIVSRNTAGAGYALGHSGTTVAADAVTVKSADNISSAPYIQSDDVDATSVWTTASGYTFKNGNYYIYASGTMTRSLAISTTSTNWTWNGTNNYLYYSGMMRSYYVYYSNGFSLSTSASSIYLYKKTVVTIDEDEDPTIIANPTSLTLAATTGKTASGTFNVKGAYLESDITATLADDNGVFSIDATSVSVADAEDGKDITVTFSPTANGTFTGTITLASSNAESVTVNLTGTATPPEIIADPESLAFNAIVTETDSKTFSVLGADLSGEVTATLTDDNGVFAITPASVSASAAEDEATFTVTFSPTAVGTYTGSVTLSTLYAESVTVQLAGTAVAPELIADPDELTFDEIEAGQGQSTTATFTVLGTNLLGNVTATVTEGSDVFSIDAATISKADAEEGATITVTFAPQEQGTYTGTVTLSSDQAESVNVQLNATATKAYPASFDVVISNVGLTTLYLDFPVKIPYQEYDPDLLGVYYITGINGKELRAARLNKDIPAHTGVIIQGNKGTYVFPKIDEATPLKYNSILSGSVEDITPAAALEAAQSSGIIYTLGRGSDSYINFYRYSGSKLSAYKAFLIYEGASGAKSLTLGFEGDATGIDTINADAEEGSWYTVQGVKLSRKPVRKGMYIHNGNTVIIQ
ncbi:MAG: S8 family serine peptidase [Prevotella sp.]|nr:S8 family serine peptidase [Prevotella sp.]